MTRFLSFAVVSSYATAAMAQASSPYYTNGNATILYPNKDNLPTINVVDTLQLSYETNYTAGVQILVLCQSCPGCDWPEYFVPGEPFPQSNTFIWSSVGNYFFGSITVYPSSCYIDVKNYADLSQFVSGAYFFMTNATDDNPKVWQASTTSSISLATSTHHSATAIPTSATTPTPTTIPSSPGLTTGAKAGIGIGAAVGALIVVAAFIYLLCIHRRLKGAEKEKSKYKGQDQPPDQPSELPIGSYQDYNKQPQHWQPKAEMPNNEWPPELGDGRTYNARPGMHEVGS